MPDLTLTVHGLEHLQRTLRVADERMGEAIEKGLQSGAAIVQRDAMTDVPVWTGKLRMSLRPGKVEGSGTNRSIRVGPAPGFGTSRRGASGSVGRATNPMGAWNRGDPQKYGPYVERGTRRMSARPFLVPALRDNVSRIGLAIRQRIRAILRGGNP